MSELVCLNCGREMDYDWAPCQNCGWKPPEPWEISEEDDENIPQRKIALNKPNSWVQITVWLVIVVSFLGLLAFLHQCFR